MADNVETCLRNGNYKDKYTWKRDKGDGEYKGLADQLKVDKDEGYEVAYFIEKLLEDNNWEVSCSNVSIIENVLHKPELSSIIMRTELEKIIVTIVS
jgi:hypothetical protein